MSPAYVDELVRLGHLAWLKADTHDGQSGQLLAEAAVQAYRRASKRRQAKGLGKMVEASERLRLYDEGETEVPERRSSGAPGVEPATGGLKGAIARGDELKRQWTQDGTLLTPKAFARRRQVSVGELRSAEARGELFSMLVDNKPYYLVELLKFAPADAAALCAALGPEDPSSKLIFFLRRHGMLDGKTVAQAVKCGDMDEALNAAAGWRERR